MRPRAVLGEIPDYYRRFIDPVDIVILKTCQIDEDGYFNLSAAQGWPPVIEPVVAGSTGHRGLAVLRKPPGPNAIDAARDPRSGATGPIPR